MPKILVKRTRESSYLKNLNKEFSKSPFYPFSKNYLPVSYDEKGRFYKTNLTKEEETYFEKAIGLAEGTLSKTSPFWIDFQIKMESGLIELDTDSAYQNLQYKSILLGNKTLVAQSLKELKENPYAEYVIIDDAMEVKVRNNNRQIKDNAILKYSQMTLEEKHDYLFLKNISEKQMLTLSPEKIADMICTDRDSDPAKFLSIITDKKLTKKVFIAKLLSKGVLRKNGSNIIFNDEPLGASIEDTVDFLDDPKNQNILIMLKKANEEAK